MERQHVVLYLSLIFGAALSCLAAWIIASRYRKRMKQLMQAVRGDDATAAPGDGADEDGVELPAPAPFTLAENRAAGIQLALLLIGISVLISITSAWIWWTLSFPTEAPRPKAIAVVALLHLWPVVPALALLWRWSRTKFFGALLLWCGVCFLIFLWRQIEYRPMQAALAIASEIGLPLVLVSLVFLGNAARAVAPWLLVPLAALVWTSFMGMELLAYLVEQEVPWFVSVVGFLGKVFGGFGLYVTMGVFIALPWLLAWWPARLLGRALGRAYSRKWLSELLVVFTAVWAFALMDRALTMAPSVGRPAFLILLALLWIPAIMSIASRWRERRGQPPTLLVLRVFQQDAQTQLLYDQVIERWRLSGNTVTIAGTDLADRTLDAGDIFDFLDRKLAERFVSSAADVPRRIATFDLGADVDGRYWVNECYCHDSTWQVAMQALARRSDVVLMDLRGFQARNAGSRYELATLAQGARELRVVLLFDQRTDREAARLELAKGREQRFEWIEASRLDRGKRREVLASLFA
ncbi:MAG TPA: hypothetical protein VMF52_16080 [Steroidobacteraceae bacterium]|nr:hypothetical protein [Steroidobacteraceae bacterium]